MPSTLIDSIFFKDLYGTDDMRAVFSDKNLLQKWLDVEVALAQAEAEVGLIPNWAADEIARKGRADLLDSAAIKRDIDQTVHPIVPVIRALEAVCEHGAGEFVHWGATTQDIMDTASVLQIKQAMDIFQSRLRRLSDGLAVLAERHRSTLMPGRTHGQHALPITFGFKVAQWLAEVMRHQERLTQLKPRVLTGQFGGAAGTLAAVAEQGFEIQRRMMARLGLNTPLITWHTARDCMAEFAAWLGLVAATLGKIAQEVILLQKTEVWEVEEPFNPGKVGSSTMPHKRNPMLCEALLALARLVINAIPLGLDAMLHEHERDWTNEHIEWAFLPEACIMTDGALVLTVRVVEGLHVHVERMAANLGATRGLWLSEAVMLALAEKVGRQTAHEVVYRCAMRVVDHGIDFRRALADEEIVARHLSDSDIDRLLDPQRYIGLASEFVDRVLERYESMRAGEYDTKEGGQGCC
ncbi:MAG: adenylosuccinate lyase [Anaerolineae bacterium]|nr:adenylosuccinate lyase [Thermoflexales bacterium]MDW8406229.1 adenylosuccinate lyase [Anaerolineae bacterium]